MKYLFTLVYIVATQLSSMVGTINVPVDQPTIQAGLDVASAGDTVLVARGTYFEHESVMKSGVCPRSESGSAEGVTIDGQQSGSVIHCSEVNDTASIIGFTITGGLERTTLYSYCSGFSGNISFQVRSSSLKIL